MSSPSVMSQLRDMRDVALTSEDAGKGRCEDWDAAIAAVADLVAAAKLVNADHSAPHDCYATGPLTGDPFLDLVRCPGCELAAAIAAMGEVQ